MSVTAPKGFLAAGVACGIKPSGDPDLALVATAGRQPVAAAGVFTSNRATAAPVLVSADHLGATGGRAAAVVLNSGNANACTGSAGRADAERTCALVGEHLGTDAEHVLVCSTGLIGIPLPMDAVEAGVPKLAAALGPDGAAAAEAIRTTDTHRKETVIRGDGFTVGGMAKGAAMLAPDMATMLAVLTTDTVRKEALVDGGPFTVGGMAKGAAMLAPSMATMLAVLTTDAVAEPDVLAEILHAGVADSFNALLVDGATSTNDTVLLLANGASGHHDDVALAEVVAAACTDLARQMGRDAEGATKLVEVRVTGAASDEDARRAARAVAGSMLCKCSWYGCDPYWGRIVSELGSSRAAFDPDTVSVAYGDVTVCRNGVPAAHDTTALERTMAARDLLVAADLGLGPGRATVLTCDLTHGYVDENKGTS
jgi:glutamate N-acetyltransferase/amino-acid N-acetyltransferase